MMNLSGMIELEDENILRTIFKDKYPETWRENPDVSRYLMELSSHGLDRINKEPDVLAEEKLAILEQTQDLVYHNYKTFIQTANCSREIFKDFNLMEQHLNVMSVKLPDFIEKCQQFSKTSQDINTSRRLNSLTLSRHTQLLEILEMPQLMDTCVRNDYYDEALDISNYVIHLEKKLSTIPLISTIARDVQLSLKLMLCQLIEQLRTNVQLPQCLKVISYLRRMDVFSDEELRIKFLQARDSWFQGILADIPSDDPYEHITKVIVVSRVHLFDIMTQYRAIFSDEDPIVLSMPVQPSEDIMFCSRAAIVHSWVFQKVSQFLDTLERDLDASDLGGRLDSVLGQCMYFGLSFSRVGADFRVLLVPIFNRAVLRNFQVAIDEVSDSFQDAMKSFVLAATPTVMISSILEASTALQDKLHPPLYLIEFNPLAELCNGILTAFNSLRILAPVSIVGEVRAKLMDCLLIASKTIVDFNRTEENSMIPREKENFSKLCHYFAQKLVPYIDCCFNALFPPQQLAQILGISLSEFGKLKNLGQLDVKAILEPMTHLLPAEEKFQVNINVQSASIPKLEESSDQIRPESEKDFADDGDVRAKSQEQEMPVKFQIGDDQSEEENVDNRPNASPLPASTLEEQFEQDENT